MIRWIVAMCCIGCACTSALSAQVSHQAKDEQLKFVIYLSRHGVRSPTGKVTQYAAYSKGPWPAWDVPPGYLTKHGYHLMELFGAYDRLALANRRLLSASGCADASSVTFYADSDQRTRQTGEALAKGMFPGCNITVSSLKEGDKDPLFHPVESNVDPKASHLTVSALAGRIGNDPGNITQAHKAQLSALDNLLETCGSSKQDRRRLSLFEIPSVVVDGRGDRPVDVKGPLSIAGTFTENFLLEYTEGMNESDVGWGCVDGEKLRNLIDLHTASVDLTQRTPAIARLQAANLLNLIQRSLEQAITQNPVKGTLGRPSDKVLFLIGHDTNLINIAGLLQMNWIIDGRRDDTPPGGALILELWRNKNRQYSVRAYFTAQTLEQMRASVVLAPASPPAMAPLFIPECSGADFSCSWNDFSSLLKNVTRRPPF
jgi:4-phytase / acid phosphatase